MHACIDAQVAVKVSLQVCTNLLHQHLRAGVVIDGVLNLIVPWAVFM